MSPGLFKLVELGLPPHRVALVDSLLRIRQRTQVVAIADGRVDVLEIANLADWFTDMETIAIAKSLSANVDETSPHHGLVAMRTPTGVATAALAPHKTHTEASS